uniref:Uncharacterized protein n=1 Tax=Caenorhabditis japonica TaxID=281687 RepID=A0A8R1DTA4_CAEJA
MCNGLSDEEDLEKMAIYECIEEMGFLKCQKCSELFENEETPTVTKID